MKNETWKRLYELTEELNELKPWLKMWSRDYVSIELKPDEVVYCTIMGQLGECIGIAMYEGDAGYEDLCSVSAEYDDVLISKYVMYEQRCLTFYMGDREEVPENQKKIIKELGLKYRGHNNWPYFISFEAQYFPSSINDHEAKRMVEILEVLLDVLKAYCQDTIDVDFEKDEIIYAHKEKEEWIYEAMSLPREIDKFSPIELSDQKIYSEIKSQQQTDHEIYIDLIYMNAYIDDREFKKPINSLMFIVVDKQTEMIMQGGLLSPKDDEIESVLNFFIPYILNEGRPRTVYVRNPRVYSAVLDICSQCGISMDMDDFYIVDEIVDEMDAYM